VSIRIDRKIKNGRTSVTHEEVAGRPSTVTTDDIAECVRDVVLLDRILTIDKVANRLKFMKNDFVISFIFKKK
jgi:hypothetical protein